MITAEKQLMLISLSSKCNADNWHTSHKINSASMGRAKVNIHSNLSNFVPKRMVLTDAIIKAIIKVPGDQCWWLASGYELKISYF